MSGRNRPRRRVVIAAAGVVVVVATVVYRQATQTQTPAETAPSAVAPAVSDEATASAPVGPMWLDASGVPHGWRHDGDGALAAAVSAVRLTGPIARAGFITRGDMIRALASTRFGPELAAVSASQLEEMTIELGAVSIAPGDLVWAEIPLTSRVVASDDQRARAQVWSVLVVAVPDVGAPRQLWRTVTVDLVWEADDWKVDGWTTAPGPTPLLDAMGTVATTAQIAEVVAWPAVTGGGG